MDRSDGVDAFELNDDVVFNHQISLVGTVEWQFLVDEVDSGALCSVRDAGFRLFSVVQNGSVPG